jgi:uncharacterized tellurite resistance protein B-like protein
MRRKKITQKDINLFVALIVLIIGIITAIIMGIIKILQAIFSRKKNSESIQYRASQKNEDLPGKNDVDPIISGSGRYQISTETPDSEAPDQTPFDYQSITVHGHSIYDTPDVYITSATSGMNWVGSGQFISVQGFTIQNPLTYWSNNNFPEASCITAGLKAEKHVQNVLPALPYWPQYSSLTPAQRGKYLTWMSRGRNDDLDEIGYAFIFFYGLERRAIIDKTDHEIILSEVRRLLSRYPISGSFNSYLNHFTAYVVGSRLADIKNTDIRKFFPEFDNLDEYPTKIVLSWHWSNNLPVPWDLCYSLSKNSAGFQRTNITRKAPELLKQLFRKKFLDQFPEGIPFSSEYDQFQLNYRPASPSLLHYVGYSGKSGLIEPLVVPIPSLNSPHYEKLKKIWDNCIEELKPAMNRLNKSDGTITRDVYSVLPDTLKSEISHPEQDLWRNFLSAKQQSDGSIVLPISDIAHQIGIDKRDVLTTSQCKTVTSTVRDFGWFLVPDQTISGSSYKWNDTVAIIPLGDKEKPVSENFQSTALIFEIAYGIAASDENLSDTEKNYLHKFVSEKFSLNIFEIECLKGLQKVLQTQPPALSKIGKRLSKYLNPEQKLALANFLGNIVLLDNKFTKEEQKSLRTVFKALEIDPAVSDELIKKLLVGHIPEEPITVLKAGKSRKGETIPPQAITPEFSINKEKLKQTLEDTRAVQNILASVFEQEEEEIVIDLEPEVKIPKSPVNAETRPDEFDLPFPPETIPSLDSKYLSMLHEIMKSNEVSQDDFTSLARKYNLMPRAAFDDINDWASEKLGDFLLEESESCIVINYKR